MSSDPTLQQTGEALARAQQRSLKQACPPANVPGYEPERFLGAGAYGEVWVAVDRNTGRRVAIKFYTHRGGVDWSLLSREVEKLAFLFADRHVVQLVDVGWDSDPPYYVMEYLEHGSLADRLQQGPLPVEQAVSIFREVAVGLVHAHGKGVLHCDLKPGNVLLDQDVRPRLADFGQSRLSHEQTAALGTLFYMAPEQADLQAVPDARWDVYALGALLYCMLTGEPPYRSDDAAATIHQSGGLEEQLDAYRRLLHDAPRARQHRRVAGVDRDLVEIVDRCLAVHPHKRYANPQAVLEALNARAARKARRPLVVLGAVGPALLLGVMLLLTWNVYGTAVRQTDEALSARALDTNQFAAQFVADNVAHEIDRRWQVLEDEAARDELRHVLAAATGKPEGTPQRELLQHLLERIQGDHWALDAASWFVTDAAGVQLARGPYDERTIGKDFSFRDYFHGQGKDLPEGTAGVEPIRGAYRSHVFKSQATGNPMVAFSVPVWGAGLGEQRLRVIGVLATTVELGHFAELRAEHGSTANQIAVLVDSRPDADGRQGRLLEHPALAESLRREQRVPAVYLDPVEVRRISELRRLRSKPLAAAGQGELVRQAALDADYRDPLGGQYEGRWLAAIQPVLIEGRPEQARDTGWAVIVQERHAAAVEPARQLGARLVRTGLVAVAVVLLVITGSWLFVFGLLTDFPRFRLLRLLRRQVGLPSAGLSGGQPSSQSSSPTPSPTPESER